MCRYQIRWSMSERAHYKQQLKNLQDVGSVTLVVNSNSKLLCRIAEEGWISEDVDGLTTDWWKEDIEITTCEQLGIHSTGLCEMYQQGQDEIGKG